MSVVFTSSCRTDDSLTAKAMDELRHTLENSHEFVKAHAAEYLIWLGHKEEAKKIFLQENKLYKAQPKYRIVIWRVLAEAETEPEQKKVWIDKIYNAFGDINGPDRLHATETLAKLQLAPLTNQTIAIQKSVNDESRNMQVYIHWALSYAADADKNKYKQDFLNIIEKDTNEIARVISAFVIRKLNNLTNAEWTKLALDALAQVETSAIKNTMLNTTFATTPEHLKSSAEYLLIKKGMIKNYQQFSAGDRIGLSQALAENGDITDLPLLTSYLNNENNKGIYESETELAADVRAAAAYAILKIKSRETAVN